MRIALALAALTVIPGLPLAALLLPRVRQAGVFLSLAGAFGILWTALATVGLAAVRVPLSTPILLVTALLPAVVLAVRRGRRKTARERLRALRFSPTAVAAVAVTAGALVLPLLTVQRGLPTGDSQKAIYWAERIRSLGGLPDYGEALTWNRDPGDFATPALHSLTAAASELSGDPLRGTAWFSLLASLILAGLASGLATVVLPSARGTFPLLAFLFAATNHRFLRYAVTPGYHYQNLFGELFLTLALLLLLFSVSERGARRLILLSLLAATALPLTHQFSAFLGAILLPILLLVLLVRHRGEVSMLVVRLLPTLRRRMIALAAFILGGVLLLRASPLPEKLPHLVTAEPHLRPYVVPLTAIPNLLGITLTFLALAGIGTSLVLLRRRALDARTALLLLWVFLLFLLSQGARSVLDIPSARTLFLLSIPLSLFAALAVSTALDRVGAIYPRFSRALAPIALALVLSPTAGATLNDALQSIDHARQADSTLTPATLDLQRFLQEKPPVCSPEAPPPCPDAILVDDWNRRRTTWAILSPFRMLTRVGADLAVIAREAKQNAQRKGQYDNLLDFEQIYALGNQPAIIELLRRHGIAFLVGARGLSDDVFASNPALDTVYANEEIVLYSPRGEVLPSPASPLSLLLPSPPSHALANDIGDREDLFAHLPISLLAPRVSEPAVIAGNSTRAVESFVSRLGLNVGTYVPTYWDADADRTVDGVVTLRLRSLGNGAVGRLYRGTTVFARFALHGDGNFHEVKAIIPAGELPLDEQGLAFLTLRLDRAPLVVDWIIARHDPPERVRAEPTP